MYLIGLDSITNCSQYHLKVNKLGVIQKKCRIYIVTKSDIPLITITRLRYH
jgi:hypothetical protein